MKEISKKSFIISIIIVFVISILTVFFLKNSKENNLIFAKKSNEIKAEYENEGYTTVKFNDEKMAKAVYGALEASAFPQDYQYLSGTELPILQTVLENTTQLTLYNSKTSDKIKNISGIEKFSNLTNLKLANNLITDISPIQNLIKLTSLDLSLNENITDISCLQANTELQILNLAGNKISDLEGISKLYKLTTLNIGNNQITAAGIEDIIALKNIVTLNAENNQIDDIEPILNLTNLKDLNLYGNRIALLENISNLRKLEKLNLGKNGLGTNQIKYIFKGVNSRYSEDEEGNRTVVSEYNSDTKMWENNENYDEKLTYKTAIIGMLDNLQYLNIEINGMTDLFTDSNIQYMTNLKEVYAQDNGISRLTNIYKLVNLEVLNLNNNNITDLEPLFKTYKIDDYNYQLFLQKFTSISLADNEIELIYSIQKYGDITEIYSFADFKDLKALNLSQNHIYNISTIAYKEFNSIQLFEQTIELSVMKRDENDDFQEVILPQIFKYTLESDSNVFSEEEFSYSNCSKTSEDKKITDRKITFVDTYNLGTNKKDATVRINGGFADGTIITIKPTSTTTTTNGLETMAFTDKNLYNAVKDNLIKYTSDEKIDSKLWDCYDTCNLINIYYSTKGLQALKELDASNYEIESVDGIKRLIALTNIDISNNKITDISEIALLPNITTLNVGSNKIENLSQFNYILGVANRETKQKKTTDSLAWYKKITSLTAYTNSIDSIEAIATCTSLTNLNLLQNKITDITDLANLTNLQSLNLTDNYINEIETIENLIKLESLWLGNNHGKIEDKDLIHLSNLPALTSLDLSSNYLKDISSLNSITSLRTLNLNTNFIEDINTIKNLTRLGYLELSQNKISDLTGINKFTQLTTLILKGNKISDVSNLGSLTSLVTLDLSYNKVEDISTIEILDTTYNLDVISLNDQRITIELTEEQTEGTEEIELPSLFSKALIENNLVYMSGDFNTNNCTVDKDRKIITVSELGSKIAWVKIKDGIAEDSQVAISEPLRGTISYSTEEPTKDDVVASINFNRASVAVTNNGGNNTYTFTENGEFTFEFEDDYGFTGTATAKVDWIDKEGPEVEVIYSKTEITNENVLVTITADEACQQITGWDLSIDKKILTKTYSSNTNEEIILKDNLGNETRQEINIQNIDKIAPLITGVENGKTYNNIVKPTITDDNLESVELKESGIKVEGYISGSQISENGEYKLTAKDKAGNESVVNFTVKIELELAKIAITTAPTKTSYIEGENFDKTGMKVTATYNNGTSKEVTNYTVTDGTNLAVGKTNVTISYTENGITKTTTQNITVSGAAGQTSIIKETSEYVIETEGEKEYINQIEPGTTIQQVKTNIKEEYEIEIYDKNNNKITNETTKIGTGMKIEAKKNGSKVGEYIAIIIGDCNGTGTTNVSDLTLLMRSVAENLATNKDETKILTGAYSKAVDLTGKGRLNSADITKLIMFIAENK